MNATKARNLAILLENQTRAMSRMSEAQLASAFSGYTPENMLRLIRLSYPNSIRGDIFTEFAMETANDSIKYIMPVYAASEPDGKAGRLVSGDVDARYDMTGKRDVAALGDVMYESLESQFVTEYFTVDVSASLSTKTFSIDLTNAEPFKTLGYVDGYSKFVADGAVVAVQSSQAHVANWFCAEGYTVEKTATGFAITTTGTAATKMEFIGAYDSEKDLAGKYLGEVELVMKDYHFQPRPISLGVTWTQLTELVLDTSFGVSAEEMLMDSAAQEIKKSLDFQAIKYANAMQKLAGVNAEFNAEAPGAEGITTKDSYWHTAQLVQQSIDRIGDLMLNKINRGGVSAIVGGPKAVTYLKLNKAWSDTGRQPAIGGHKVGELDGIPVFKVPAGVIADNELLTTWKNDQADGDVSIAIGTLMPFYSTGALQRKNFYKEAGVARFEDTKALQPGYLGRITINGLR